MAEVDFAATDSELIYVALLATRGRARDARWSQSLHPAGKSLVRHGATV